jgi:hypothetical protein
MPVPPLIAEATKKSGVIWIGAGNTRTAPVWHHWQDDAAYVLVGGAEQPARGLPEVTTVTVTVPSKTTGGAVVTWVATVTRVSPTSEEWDRVVPELLTKRLNAPDGQQAPIRWAMESVLVRLDPTGEILDLPAESGAAPPPETPATTSGPLPFVVGRRRSRA